MNTKIENMTPEQKKRLGELLMHDISTTMNATVARAGYHLMNIGSSIPAMSVPNVPNMQTESIDDLIDNIERKQKERAERAEYEHQRRIDRMFNREELFRFAYVPFVIAELVWDYADTVIYMARDLDNPVTRRLARAIRNARAEYDRERHRYIDRTHRDREIENGYVFEDGIRRITQQMLTNIRIDINSEYPELNESSRDLLVATHQCNIMSKGLLRYLDKQSARIEKRVGHRIGKMLPPSYYVMDKLIPEYFGDKPASDNFKKLMNQYVETLATQMALVELNDVSPENNNPQYNFKQHD